MDSGFISKDCDYVFKVMRIVLRRGLVNKNI
jgi:hypothetical protein